jgi:hypothetical protein
MGQGYVSLTCRLVITSNVCLIFLRHWGTESTVCGINTEKFSFPIYVFCMDHRTNSDYFPLQHSLIGFLNGSKVSSLRRDYRVFLRDVGNVDFKNKPF